MGHIFTSTQYECECHLVRVCKYAYGAYTCKNVQRNKIPKLHKISWLYYATLPRGYESLNQLDLNCPIIMNLLQYYLTVPKTN